MVFFDVLHLIQIKLRNKVSTLIALKKMNITRKSEDMSGNTHQEGGVAVENKRYVWGNQL